MHNCRRLAVDSLEQTFVIGTSTESHGWADCIWKLSVRGIPQESLTSFTNIGALTIDRNDNIYVIELMNGVLVKLNPNLKELGRTKLTYKEKRQTKSLSNAQDIALDGQGYLYVLDSSSIVKFHLPF